MGCVQSELLPADVDLSTVDRNADDELKTLEEQIQEAFKFKILLLGTGESGKSTILKQLKLLHKKRLTQRELKQAGDGIHASLVDCMRALVGACRTFATYELDEEGKKTEQEINDWDVDSNIRLNAEQGARFKRLFETEAIQKTYARRSEFWLLDSFSYYIQNIQRMTEPDWAPTEEDAVMARVRTTGIVVTDLDEKIADRQVKDEPESIIFQVVDVGGQRNERKKWIHCFDSVNALLFVDNLAGYDQVMFEDVQKNRMIESLELFNKITMRAEFARTPTFLFLNKKDLFEQMIMETDMKKTFPEYKGGRDYKNAVEYVVTQFRRQAPPHRQIGVEIMSARWTRDVRLAFENVKNALWTSQRDRIMTQVRAWRDEQRQRVCALVNSGRGCLSKPIGPSPITQATARV